MTPESAAQFPGLMSLESVPDDPHPDWPLLQAGDLRTGDILMMLGVGNSRVAGIELPISALIRELDGGSYSHAALVTVDASTGEPMVWDHSHDWKLSPVSVPDATRGHAYCHVYQFTKDDQFLGSERFPKEPVRQAVSAHKGDPYGMKQLMLAAVLMLTARAFEGPLTPAEMRELVDLFADALARLAGGNLDAHALICTAVPGIAYWEAQNGVPHDYALEVDLGHRKPVADDGGALLQLQNDEQWKASRERLLERLPGNIANAIRGDSGPAPQGLAQGTDGRVLVGSPALDVNLVRPSDLETSPTLVHRGRLEIPPV